ncbi:hypothetical protein GC177_00830 [bacterium]|nr:hypothetical protein [bacterium]
MAKAKKATSNSKCDYTVFDKESVRYIMMLYKARTDKGALAIIGDIEDLLPSESYPRRHSYDGRKTEKIILKYDMLRDFLGIKQITPNNTDFYFILIEFIKKQTVLEGYSKLLSFPQTHVMYGDVFGKLCFDRKIPAFLGKTATLTAGGLGARSLGIRIFPSHDIVCMFFREIPGTSYYRLRVVAFEPSYLTSDLQIASNFYSEEYLKIHIKFAERLSNTCKSFLNHLYFWDYTGMMVPLLKQTWDYDGILISDTGRSCAFVMENTYHNTSQKSFWAPTLSFIRKQGDEWPGYKRFCALPVIDSAIMDWNAIDLHKKINIPQFVQISVIALPLGNETIELTELSDFFDSMLPSMASSS